MATGRRLTADEKRLTDEQRQVVEDNRFLVYAAVRRTSRDHNDSRDLAQDGMFGLARAAQTFDPSRGTKFSTHAMHRIRATVCRSRDVEGLIRIPAYVAGTGRRSTSQRYASSAAAVRRIDRMSTMVDDSGRQWEPEDNRDKDSLDRKEQASIAVRLLATLPPRTQDVVRRRLDGETLSSIGRSIGVTKEAVRQIEKSAYAAIREAWPKGDVA